MYLNKYSELMEILGRPACLFLQLCFCIILLACPRLLAAEFEPIEGPPVFFARDLIDDEICAGEGYHVYPIVEVSDFEYVFKIHSKHGNFTAYGVVGVKNLIREIIAINYLDRISQASAFTTSLSNRLKSPFFTTFGVAKRPISTVTGLPSGIGRYLQGKFYQVRRNSSKTISRMRKSNKDEQAEDESKEKHVVQKVGKSTSKLSRKYLGYESSKRSWARTLGVDPYTDNEKLQEAMGRIAWASSIGNFAGDFAIPSSEVVSYAGKAQKYVWEKNPIALERENIRMLKKLSVSKERIREFTDSRMLSLSEKAYIAISLSSMKGAAGIEEILDFVLEQEDVRDISVVVRTLAILQRYSENTARIERLSITEGMIQAYSENGYIVLPLAVDYLHWSPLIAEALAAEPFAMENREIWISGNVSPIAKERLESLGWYVFKDIGIFAE